MSAFLDELAGSAVLLFADCVMTISSSLSLSSYLPSSSSCPEVWLTGSHIFSYFRRVALASRSIFPRFARRTLTCAHTSHAIICPAPKKRERREKDILFHRELPVSVENAIPFSDLPAMRSSIRFAWMASRKSCQRRRSPSYEKKKNLSTVQYRSFLISRFFFLLLFCVRSHPST